MNTQLKNARDWLNDSCKRSFYVVLQEAKITPRQIKICELKFVSGLANYQIAMQMNLSVQTIDKELNTIYKRINKVLESL